ncbi:MAG: hypothetical protein ABIH26_03230 [Candidatus Eisenbacteria bacterium]
MRSVHVVLVALSAALLAGCYTVLDHPSEVAMTETIEGETERVPCADCHYESEWFGYYDHQLIYGWPGLLSYDRSDWWFDYYRRPWWWDGYWYDDSWHVSGSGPAGSDQSSWRKRALRRGEPSGDPAPAGVYPGGAAQGSGGTAPASPPSDSGGGEKKPSEPEPAHRKKTPRR